MSEKSDAEEHLEDVLVVVQLLSNEISMSDNLRPQLDTILSRIPLEIMEKVNQQKHQLSMLKFLKNNSFKLGLRENLKILRILLGETTSSSW